MLTRRKLLHDASALVVGGTLLGACANGSGTDATAADTRGWAMPAEDHVHARTWMAFPSSADIWGSQLAAVQRDIANVSLAIAGYEPVTMLVRPSARQRARRLVGSDVELIDAPVDDLWARDTLPCFQVSDEHRGTLAAGVLTFNGWGKKQRHAGDARLAREVAAHVGARVRRTSLVGEGGGLEVDGAGTLLAAKSSWVNPNRNPGLSEREISRRLRVATGAQRVIWVDGVAGHDITDGHIDTLARFVDPTTILLEDPGTNDVWGRAYQTTRAALQREQTTADRPYRFVTLSQPSQRPSGATDDFLSSYVNYYVCNGGVVMPKFGDRAVDAAARSALASAYPDREITALRIDAIASGGGGIHCSTQQEPKPS
jgi:agmatine deiminase